LPHGIPSLCQWIRINGSAAPFDFDLLLCESKPKRASDSRLPVSIADAVAQVIEKLRLRLVRLMGVDGFRSLLSRALTLAKTAVPSLQSVQVRANGTLDGFNEIAPLLKEAGSEGAKQAGTILVACMLELLATFIGEQITLNLVRDEWPNASLQSVNAHRLTT
jgi:hypothetical protein